MLHLAQEFWKLTSTGRKVVIVANPRARGTCTQYYYPPKALKKFGQLFILLQRKAQVIYGLN